MIDKGTIINILLILCLGIAIQIPIYFNDLIGGIGGLTIFFITLGLYHYCYKLKEKKKVKE